MFKILVVEDNPETLEQLGDHLREEFPGSTIDCAGNIAEAAAMIEEAAHDYQHDAAVLDFRLPASQGAMDEVDESLCKKLRETSPALVIHITAYPNDLAVLEHMRDYHLSWRGPRSELIAKNLAGDGPHPAWSNLLVHDLKAYLYGSRIENALDEIFGESSLKSPSERRRIGRVGTRGQGLTHDLDALTRDIKAHWGDLDDHLKARITSIFRVDTDRDPIRISLL